MARIATNLSARPVNTFSTAKAKGKPQDRKKKSLKIFGSGGSYSETARSKKENRRKYFSTAGYYPKRPRAREKSTQDFRQRRPLPEKPRAGIEKWRARVENGQRHLENGEREFKSRGKFLSVPSATEKTSRAVSLRRSPAVNRPPSFKKRPVGRQCAFGKPA